MHIEGGAIVAQLSMYSSVIFSTTFKIVLMTNMANIKFTSLANTLDKVIIPLNHMLTAEETRREHLLWQYTHWFGNWRATFMQHSHSVSYSCTYALNRLLLGRKVHFIWYNSAGYREFEQNWADKAPNWADKLTSPHNTQGIYRIINTSPRKLRQ